MNVFLAVRALLLFSTTTPGNTAYTQTSIMALMHYFVFITVGGFLVHLSRKQGLPRHGVVCLCGKIY